MTNYVIFPLFENNLKVFQISILRDFTPGQRERSPDYQKLRARVTHIWGNRRGQPDLSAMEGSHPGGTAFRITVTPTPGKYNVSTSFTTS